MGIAQTTGTIRCRHTTYILDLPPNVAIYYQSLIHIRKYHPYLIMVHPSEQPTELILWWGRHEGEKITVYYSPQLWSTSEYYFLKASSPRIGQIRQQLGLPEFRQGYTDYPLIIADRKES